jgi:hypothetical protein
MIIASLRTILDIGEKGVDGLPVWGPKAAFGATSAVLKAIEVRPNENDLFLAIDVKIDELRERGGD